jgi:hypothetical protein
MHPFFTRQRPPLQEVVRNSGSRFCRGSAEALVAEAGQELGELQGVHVWHAGQVLHAAAAMGWHFSLHFIYL